MTDSEKKRNCPKCGAKPITPPNSEWQGEWWACNNSATTDGQQTEIMKLAKEGKSAEKIAETLSIPQGEVRLVLDLRNKFSQMAKT